MNKILIPFAVIAWILLACIGSYLFYFTPCKLEAWGQLGDSFGAISSFFAALALILTSREMSQQMKESKQRALRDELSDKAKHNNFIKKKLRASTIQIDSIPHILIQSLSKEPSKGDHINVANEFESIRVILAEVEIDLTIYFPVYLKQFLLIMVEAIDIQSRINILLQQKIKFPGLSNLKQQQSELSDQIKTLADDTNELVSLMLKDFKNGVVAAPV